MIGQFLLPYRRIRDVKLYKYSSGCGGPLKPEVVQSTAYSSGYPASNVLILGEKDAYLGNGKYNIWLAGKKTKEGFTLKVDTCTRMIVGCQIKNLGKGYPSGMALATKDFQVSGSMNENGPWETLLEDQLVDTSKKAASLLNFAFDQLVEIQFIKFDIQSYWGKGGGLQYFAAIPGKNINM